ncbi:MAG: cytochrome C [Proteobacteria bacterium]|nr:cytochrome C [Pseudomonadota bacterium]
MKTTLLAISAFIGIGGFNGVFADDEKMPVGHHHHEMSTIDARIPLKVSPEMKRNQLSNMRGHVEAINSIVGLMSENKFEEASKVAHSKLGLSPEMQSMCGMFNDENFEKLGLAFHKSGDDLGDTLQTKDMYASLRALNKTTQICVACHATYRQ